MKTQVISIDVIKMDKKIYPRNGVNWLTVYDYVCSLEAGAKFPPIKVATKNKKYILLDGFHRVAAYKKLKVNSVVSEVMVGLSEKEMYMEAVRSNIAHGRILSQQEKRIAIMRLRGYKIKDGDIAELMCIRVDKIEPFVAKRLTISSSGKEYILKSEIKHLVGQTVGDSIDNEQKIYAAKSQCRMLDELISLLEHNHLDFKNKEIRERIDKIMNLLGALV
jgi:hypothetical protein